VEPDAEPTPLRLMIYDRTCRGRRFLPGLSHVWGAGGWLYRGLGRVDACHGVDNWPAALAWLAEYEPERKIAEIQYWGHGKWGAAKIGMVPLDIRSLRKGSDSRTQLDRIGKRMLQGDQGLLWFRTCETFGAAPGHAFASAITDVLGCRAAGHTYIIGHVQSGLHTLMPGVAPHWSVEEALTAGTPEQPERAAWSSFRAPNTITFLHGRIPAGY
jgi:hypothetical protein